MTQQAEPKVSAGHVMCVKVPLHPHVPFLQEAQGFYWCVNAP